jgi:hypothetical protein
MSGTQHPTARVTHSLPQGYLPTGVDRLSRSSTASNRTWSRSLNGPSFGTTVGTANRRFDGCLSSRRLRSPSACTPSLGGNSTAVSSMPSTFRTSRMADCPGSLIIVLRPSAPITRRRGGNGARHLQSVGRVSEPRTASDPRVRPVRSGCVEILRAEDVGMESFASDFTTLGANCPGPTGHTASSRRSPLPATAGSAGHATEPVRTRPSGRPSPWSVPFGAPTSHVVRDRPASP